MACLGPLNSGGWLLIFLTSPIYQYPLLVKLEPLSPLSLAVAGGAPIPAVVDPLSSTRIMEENGSFYSTYVHVVKRTRQEVTMMCNKVADLESKEQVCKYPLPVVFTALLLLLRIHSSKKA